MNQEQLQEIAEKFDHLFPPEMSFDHAVEKLKSLKADPFYEDYLTFAIDIILDSYCEDYSRYPEKQNAFDRECREKIHTLAMMLPSERPFYFAVDAFFQGKKSEFIRYLGKQLQRFYAKDGERVLTEADFSSDFLSIFKNAYPGFWKHFSELLKDYRTEPGIPDLCSLIETYYQCRSAEEALGVLLDFLPGHPELSVPKELTASTYYDLKMWNNALAYLEQAEDTCVFLYKDTVYFMMAYCSGKCRNYAEEERYYRKSLEILPEQGVAKNNLAYCLYRQGKYGEARKILEECLETGLETAYAPDNYIRVLLATGQFQDAKDFLESGKYRISKQFRDKIEKSDGKNHTAVKSKTGNGTPDTEEDAVRSESGEVRGQIVFAEKAGQFSSEKLLEDELPARIESGIPVFGLNLKVWKRKGEYGRQYILPTGKRLDLLCEDSVGNIYIIELKKDSGYDDPYEQTAEYVDWFENEERFRGRRISGIICLNQPSKAVLEKVHRDDRIRIFEYQISYAER